MNKKTIFIILIVCAAAIWMYNITLLAGNGESRQKTVIDSSGKQIVDIASFLYTPDFRDPFFCEAFMRPPRVVSDSKTVQKRAADVRLPSCSIGGIVLTAGNPMALFVYNGKSNLVKVGDVIDGIEIKKITSNQVFVRYKGKSFCLEKK